MHPPDPLHLCTTCPVSHYDNCDACFGFGVYEGGEDQSTDPPTAIPVSAAEAYDLTLRRSAVPCPVCGSTVVGPPSK